MSHFRVPIRLRPREGKYYGTVIEDAFGDELFKLWDATGRPSRREIDAFGDGYSDEAWADYCCDSHWESEATLAAAEWLVDLINREDR